MHIPTELLAVVAANVLVSLKGFNDYSFFDKYKFQIGAIRRGEHIRMFTSGFLHIDQMHLFFNMITLYFFTSNVVSWLGQSGFFIVYLVSLLGGSLLALFLHKNDYHYSAVGASGAVTGIVYAAILLNPGMELMFIFLPIPMPAYIFGVVYLLYSIYGMKNKVGNIGHSAHFGGAIGGYVTTLILRPHLFETNPIVVALLAVPILILFVLEKTNKI
jgi:membrane associated rhomboid family serine protease